MYDYYFACDKVANGGLRGPQGSALTAFKPRSRRRSRFWSVGNLARKTFASAIEKQDIPQLVPARAVKSPLVAPLVHTVGK